MKDIVIIGAGGFGKETAWVIERINSCKPEWNLLGFLDDNNELCGKKIYKNYAVLGDLSYLSSHHDVFYICAIGNAKAKENVVNKIGNNKPAIIIDPSAIVSENAVIGGGTIIFPNVIVSVGTKIANHCSLIYGSIIGHDSEIGEFSTIYPSVNVSGNVKIGKVTEVGTGTKIIQQKNIGNNCIIGAGAVVIDNITNSSAAVGVPAKVIKQN